MNRFKSFDSWLNNKSIVESENQIETTNEAEMQQSQDVQSTTTELTTTNPTISDDVDNIMNSLEVLSAELTEQMDIQIESILNEEIEAINENFLETLKKQIMSMKAYATLTSAYPKFKKDESKKKVNKIIALGNYDISSEEQIEKLKEKTREKYDKAIENAKSIENAAKKQLAVKKLRDARDEALKVGKDSSIQKKVDAGKAKLTAKLDAAIRDSAKDITDLVANQKIESELLKKQWDKEKLEIDDQAAFKLIDQELEAQLEFAGDSPEAQKRYEASSKKAKAELAKDSARKSKELDQDIKELSDEYEKLSNGKDAKQKEANLKIKTFFDNGRTYSQTLSATLGAGGEPSAEQKATLIQARKDYNAAKNAITSGTFTVADPSLSKEDAEEQFVQFKEMLDRAVEEYDVKVKGFEKESGETETETETLTDSQKTQIKAEEANIVSNQEKIDAEMAKPEEERNQQKIEGLKAGIAKSKQDILDIKSGSSESVSIDTESSETITEDRAEEIEDENNKLAETEETEEEVEANEATVVVDATDPKSKILKKLLKKHNVKLEVINKVGPGGGFPEVELTGSKEDLQAVLHSEDGWYTDDLDEYIEESNGTFTVKVKALNEEEAAEEEDSEAIEESCGSCNCNPCECEGTVKESCESCNCDPCECEVTEEDELSDEEAEAVEDIIDDHEEDMHDEDEDEEEDEDEIDEGRKTIDPDTFGDDKLSYDDQFRGKTSLSKSLASELGFDPKKPWTGGVGFDYVSLYAIGSKSGTILDDALTGKYTYAELLAAAKDFLGIKESEEVEDNTIAELSEKATAAGLNDLASEILTKDSWQVAEGTTLRSMYESRIKKANADSILNEQRYNVSSVKDAFTRLM